MSQIMDGEMEMRKKMLFWIWVTRETVMTVLVDGK